MATGNVAPSLADGQSNRSVLRKQLNSKTMATRFRVASDGSLTVNGDKTTALLNTNVVGHGGTVDIGAPIVGSGPGGGGTFTLGGDAHGGSTQVTLGAAVDSSETFTLNSGFLTLN